MNIWLDLTHSTHEYGNKCPSDCKDDTCGQESLASHFDITEIPSSSIFIENVSESFSTHTFLCHQTLHTQQYKDGLWLLCNPSKAGNIVLLDTEAYRLLQRFSTPKILQEVIDASEASALRILHAVDLFTRSGLLQDCDQPATAPDSKQEQILAAWLHVTNACNLSCHYCYVSKSSEHMADDTAKRSVDAIIRSAMRYRHRGIHLTYAGGESTLRLPQVLATHDYASQKAQEHGLSFAASLLSNGVALLPRAIEQLKQRQIGVGISLDGIGDAHDRQRPLVGGQGSFRLVDRGITRLLEGGLIPSINVTVTQRNLDDLPELLEYILQRDLPFGLSYYRDNECSAHLSDLQFTEAQMISGMRKAFAYIEEHLPQRPLAGLLVDKAYTGAPSQYKCGVGRNYLAIDQRGGIAKCHADITDTITSIDADNPLQVVREQSRGVQAVAIDEKEGCRTCEWRYWCSGGCPMLTYRLTGRSDIRSPNCAIYKALFPEALRLEALRLLKYKAPIVL